MTTESNTMTTESTINCSLCAVEHDNTLCKNYPCCNQTACNSCSVEWFRRKQTCPFCRALVSNQINRTRELSRYISQSRTPLVSKFTDWCIQNDISIRPYYINLWTQYLSEIDTLCENSTSDTICIQVSSNLDIHNFKYNKNTIVNDINFIYNEHGTIQVKGGDYYRYKQRDTQMDWWWLHSYVGEVRD